MLTGLATIAGGILMLFALWEGGWVWTGATCLLALLVVGEWRRAFRQGDRPFLPAAAWAAMLATLLGLTWLPEPDRGPALFACLWVFVAGTLLAAMWRFPEESPIESAGGTFLITLYLGVGFGAFLLLRHLQGPSSSPLSLGPVLPAGLRWSLLAIAATWSVKGAAALPRLADGGQRFAPGLSPELTWEGLLIGLLGGSLIGLVVGATLEFIWWKGLVVGLLCGLLTPIGSLVLSAVRRDLQREANAPLPVAVSQRVESLLLTLPAVYLLAVLWS